METGTRLKGSFKAADRRQFLELRKMRSSRCRIAGHAATSCAAGHCCASTLEPNTPGACSDACRAWTQPSPARDAGRTPHIKKELLLRPASQSDSASAAIAAACASGKAAHEFT